MHCVRQVTEDLYAVGANDNTIQAFERFIPLEGIGVSYNSYLLMDEKTVLFDSVDWAVCRQFLENLEYALNGRPLDYMIITHAEPDHCATLEEIIIRHPDVTLISCAQAFKMIKQFGFDRLFKGNEDVIKEGDVRSFGKHEITFISAPMVHWPEVTMAFDKTNGVLFSSDAFGGFRARNGALFSDEVEYEKEWIDEARRYYANIVVKQGAQVQNVFKKLTPLLPEINFVCPIHGLVWKKKDFGHILEKYDTWSKYEPETNGVFIAYGSMYGNTESVAIALAARLRELGIQNVRIRDVSSTHISWLMAETMRFSHVVIASVTYYLGIYPPMRSYLDDLKSVGIRNKTCAVIYNGTWAPRAGDLIYNFLANDMQDMKLMSDQVFINSSAKGEENVEDIDELAKALVDSMNGK